MKNVMKKLLCLTLAGISLFSMAACGGNGGDSSSSSLGGGNADYTEKVFADNSANHVDNTTETNNWLLQNGVTHYKIVFPAGNNTRGVSYAKTELITLSKEATGIELTAISDEGMQHSTDAKYISLGDTALYRTSGLDVDLKPLREDGARILTKDNTIYLLGGTEYGVLNAAYEFLEDILGFEAYFKNCYDLQTGVRDIKLKNYDITEIPDVPFRRQGTGAMLSPISTEYEDTMYKYRMRCPDSYSDRMTMPRMRWGEPNSAQSANHNSWHFLPKDEYLNQEDHPEQYYPEFYSAPKQNQLCYTARGDEEKYEKFLELMTAKVTQSLQFDTPDKFPKKNAILVGMEDNLDWCTCPACTEIVDYYGAESATILLFCNDLAERVHAWMNEPENAAYKREDFDIMFFAYSSCLKAPFQWNEETQRYEGRDEKIIPHKNVTIYLAVSGFDHGVSIDHKNNIETKQNIDAWTTYVDKIWTWCYGGFIQDYFAFVDVYSFYEETYNFFYSVKTEFNVSQQHSSQRGADSSFFIMAGYVGAKLMWNSTLDVNVLINKYINAMYKEAAPYMMQLFNMQRVWFNTMHVKKSWTHTFWWLTPTYTAEYWSIGYVNQCFDLLNKAYNAIERYKGDPAVYQAMVDNIDMEWLHPAKVAIDNFQKDFTKEEYNALRARFKSTVNRLGMNCVGETSSMDNYLNGWTA